MAWTEWLHFLQVQKAIRWTQSPHFDKQINEIDRQLGSIDDDPTNWFVNTNPFNL